MATVIVGTGIIGTSTAYYLSQDSSTTTPSSIHLIESSPELFASASGYAAGFLARNWFSSSVASLGALSFDLHKQLAEENNGREMWGYSRSIGTSLESTGGNKGYDWLREGTSRANAAGEYEPMDESGPAWLTRRKGSRVEIISEDDSTAQDKSLSSITVTSLSDPSKATIIPCNRLIITAGAWTPRVFKTLFPSSKTKIPISSLAGHSLLIRSPRWNIGDEQAAEKEGCHAVFTTDENGYSPEVFSRVGGEIYIAGFNDAALPLPDIATDRKIDSKSIEVLRETAKRLLGPEYGNDDLEILREGLCFRPVTERGTPIVGKVDDKLLGGIKTNRRHSGGVWVAAGHGPWGISLSLGTGKCVAEMIEGIRTSADIKQLGL